MQRGGAQLSADGVDDGPLLQEILDDGLPVVDSGPMEESDGLGVGSVDVPAGVHQLLDPGDGAVLRGLDYVELAVVEVGGRRRRVAPGRRGLRREARGGAGGAGAPRAGGTPAAVHRAATISSVSAPSSGRRDSLLTATRTNTRIDFFTLANADAFLYFGVFARYF